MQLWDRIRDWVLLLTLLSLSVLIMLLVNDPLVRALRAGALSITGQVEERLAWVGHFVRALEENDQLRTENIRLAGEVARTRSAALENDRLRAMLAFRDSSDVPLLPARIVAKDVTGQQNFLTLDVGVRDGVREGMGVIDTRGIVGKVVLVSPRYARVMPYLHTDFRTPGTVQPIGADGVVRWEGLRTDRLLLEHIVKTEPVERGQQVVTNPFSGVFPPGYPIGVVDTVLTRTGRNELLIYLTPSAPLHTIDYVFVILHLPDSEQLDLERRPIR